MASGSVQYGANPKISWAFRAGDPASEGGAEELSLGGLADELEGPEPVVQEQSSVGSWLRGLIPR